MKTCTKCKLTKELKKFHRDKSTKSGRCYWCKDCMKDYNKQVNYNNIKFIYNIIKDAIDEGVINV